MTSQTPPPSSPQAELPKAYDPSAVESEAYRVWTDRRAFHAEPTDPGNPYAIVIPPPNVTAALHLGHALNVTIQDILIRHHRMLGDNTVWLPGTDHAGIATQTIVERRVMQEEGKRRTDFSRDEFVARIQAWKDEYERKITDQLKATGASCDWDRQAFTMDPPRAGAVREAFFRLFKDGLIYRGKRLVNWDPVTQTALADDEVEMEEVDGNFYYLRYPLVGDAGQGDTGTRGQGEGETSGVTTNYVTVATTRPETMLGDTAVAINPKDPRAPMLRGKKVRLPIVNREIPIVEDDYVVMPPEYGGDPADPKAQFATGFLKVTPAHDPNDYEIGRRHDLPTINVMAPDASISDKHGWPAEDAAQAGPFLRESLLGRSREEARKRVVKWFKEHGLLEEVKPYRHSVGHSYRSHVPIEPYLSDQWYCKVTDERLAGAALRAMSQDQPDAPSPALTPSPGTPGEGRGEGPPAEKTLTPALSRGTGRGSEGTSQWQGKLRFYPARYAKTFQTWHENIRDWCISRQLWWGHRIPVWTYRETDDKARDDRAHVVAARLLEKFPQLVAEGHRGFTEVADAKLEAGTFYVYREINLSLRADDREILNELSASGFVQDPDVLDTWFSSGLWPISTLCWPDESAIRNPQSALNVWNPSSVLVTAREIITLWVSRMVMFNLYFRDRLPFYDVFIHAMIQDGEGQKMSKSLGNGVDPLDIISSHGADAMRYTLAAMTTQTQDLRMPVDLVDPHSGQAFSPVKITNSAGYVVAAPTLTSPKYPDKKLVSSYGVISGAAKATPEMPLAKNTSSKFDLGRNFANKIWNAARFALMNLESVGARPASPASGEMQRATRATPLHEPVDEQKWSLADRWIVSRFNRTVEEANAALRDYRFDVYAKACYDFFWRDLCDWYLEAIKPSMRDPARAPQTANVLASVLDGALRLMHPVIPFITETIWWRLNQVRPNRGLPGRIECPPSELLVKAKWPSVGDFSQAAEFIFPRLQEIIGAIRQLRNDHNVKPSQSVSVSILAPGDSARSILANRELIETLATCILKDVRGDLQPPKNAARALAAGCEIYVEGLVDESAEKARVAKRCEELAKQIQAMKGRLANESYIAKAPPHLVQQTRDQLAAAEAEYAKLGCA